MRFKVNWGFNKYDLALSLIPNVPPEPTECEATGGWVRVIGDTYLAQDGAVYRWITNSHSSMARTDPQETWKLPVGLASPPGSSSSPPPRGNTHMDIEW